MRSPASSTVRRATPSSPRSCSAPRRCPAPGCPTTSPTCCWSGSTGSTTAAARSSGRRPAPDVGSVHALLARVVDISELEMERALRSAVDSNVLVHVAPDGYSFRHALLAEAVYDDLLPGERVRLHASYVRRPGQQAGRRHCGRARDARPSGPRHPDRRPRQHHGRDRRDGGRRARRGGPPLRDGAGAARPGSERRGARPGRAGVQDQRRDHRHRPPRPRAGSGQRPPSPAARRRTQPRPRPAAPGRRQYVPAHRVAGGSRSRRPPRH